jgi:crossover junction endodeoxyribonuclease RuvC
VVILGIDPGFTITGFGLIKKDAGKVYLLDCHYLRMQSSKHLSERIGIFYNFFTEKIIQNQVTEISLETPFLGKNAQNFLKLGYLRGILYLLANQHSLKLNEFSPREVKQAVTGYGGASKEQVARVVLQLFPRIKAPDKLDVTDAIAITLCGVWRNKSILAQYR